MTNEFLYLRRGYNCSCEQCIPWIQRWNKELEAFTVMDTLMEEEKSLFHIYERLSAQYPDILQVHYCTSSSKKNT